MHLINVFMAGMSIMGIEMTAFRYLAPFFGTTQIIITNIIGTILLAIAIGNWFGGKLGDRYHTDKGVPLVLIGTSLLTLLIMLVSRGLLGVSATALTELDMVQFGISLVGCVLLFALPFVLLGMVSPYTIRLITREKERVGRNSGLVYFLGTIGSLIGTYLPTFLCIPLWGSQNTLIFFSALLFLTGAIGLWLCGQQKSVVVALIFFSPLAYFNGTTPVLKKDNTLAARESLYNYIQVVKKGDKTKLYLNEGHGYHSVLKDGSVLVDGVWDHFLGLPAMLPNRGQKLDVLIVGLAAGTISNIYSHFLGPELHIDGVEIDRDITEIAKNHFKLDLRYLKLHHEDGRTYLSKQRGPYDIVIVDAYKQPYLPWHLSTREFFASCRASLKPGGLLGINVATFSKKSPLLDSLEKTISTEFKHLHRISIPNHDINFTNNIVVASQQTPQLHNLASRFPNLPAHLLHKIEQRLQSVHIKADVRAFDDDWAPVEWTVDLALFNFFK